MKKSSQAVNDLAALKESISAKTSRPRATRLELEIERNTMQTPQVPPGDNPDGKLFDNPEQLMTYDQLAEMLQVSTRSLKRWKEIGEVPYVQLGRKVRFSREQIREWLHKKGA